MGKIVVKNFVVVFSDAKCDAVLEPVIIFVLGLGGGGGMGDDWRMGGGRFNGFQGTGGRISRRL